MLMVVAFLYINNRLQYRTSPVYSLHVILCRAEIADLALKDPGLIKQ